MDSDTEGGESILVSVTKTNEQHAQELFDTIRIKLKEMNPENKIHHDEVEGIAIFTTLKNGHMIVTALGEQCLHCVAQQAMARHMEIVDEHLKGKAIPVA